jgi:lysophospholipase L1-like esterase
MGAPWGIEQAPLVAEKKPDLVIIAFGMNDASGRVAPADFKGNIQKIMDAIKAAHPPVSFIVVSTMLGNGEWKHAVPELYPQYRDALMPLQGPGVAVADLTSFWSVFLERKRFDDLTGNGVNHPNDFGHRVYAQVLLSLFPPETKG